MLDLNIYKGMRVFVYLRQSNKEESGKQVQSLGDQKKDCLEIVERWGLEIVEIIEEDESAWKPHQRPKFKKMMKELSYTSPGRRRADGIVAWHPNRLSRNALEAGLIVQMLDDELIKNIFFSYAYSFHNDTSGKEHLTIEFARAKGFNDSLSEVVSRGIRSRESRGGMSTYVKFGYLQKREHKNPKLCSMFPIPDGQKYASVRRSFELAMQGVSTKNIVKILKDEFVEISDLINGTKVDARLHDTFYFGKWVVCKGKKNERVIDLRTITLPDGTRFEPVVTQEEFEKVQEVRSGNRNGAILRRKRVNPLPQLVKCHRCGSFMYASYRKIKVAGGQKEERLGYECQGYIDGSKCTQSRIKAETIFSEVSNALHERRGCLNEVRYRRYLLGLHSFLKSQKANRATEKRRTTEALASLRKEKEKLIQQKADLVSSGFYDAHSQQQFEQKILTLENSIQDMEHRKRDCSKGWDQKVIDFCKFLELRENIVQYWNSANLEQKSIFSKIAVLNLVIEDRKVAILRLKKPFSYDGEEPQNGLGALRGMQLEPNFQESWDMFSSQQSQEMKRIFLQLHEENRLSGLNFPISVDIVENSGT